MYRRRYSAAQKRAMAAAIARRRSSTRIPRYVGYGDYNVIVPAKTRKGGFNAVKTGQGLGGVVGSGLGALASQGVNLIAPGVGSAIAPAVSMAGGYLGGKLGGVAGKLFRQITGYGDYTVRQNSLGGTGPALFGDTSIRVRNREFVTFVNGSISFNNLNLTINPGNTDTFPWLSHIANSYSQWMPHGIIVEYHSVSFDAISSTNPTSGTLVIASDYNVANGPNSFKDVQQAMTQIYANQNKISKDFVHAIECDMSQTPYKWLWVNDGDTPAGTDPHLYDLCNTQICTKGQQGTDQIGMIWISYDISFQKQVAVSSSGSDIQMAKYTNGAVCTETSAQYFGTVAAPASRANGSNLDCVLTTSSISFPVTRASGKFLIVVGWYGGSGDSTVSPTKTYAACSGGVVYSTAGGTGMSTLTEFWEVTITGINASITLSGGNIPSGSNMQLYIMQLPSDLAITLPPLTEENIDDKIEELMKLINLREKNKYLQDGPTPLISEKKGREPLEIRRYTKQ